MSLPTPSAWPGEGVTSCHTKDYRGILPTLGRRCPPGALAVGSREQERCQCLGVENLDESGSNGRSSEGKAEVIARIHEGHVAHQAPEGLAVVRQEPAPHVLAQEVAEETPEVLVARVGEEAA